MLRRYWQVMVGAILAFGSVCFANDDTEPLWNMAKPSRVNVGIGQTVGPHRLEASGLAFDQKGNMYAIGEHGILLKFTAKQLDAQRKDPTKRITPEAISLLLPSDVDLEAISIFKQRIYVADEHASRIYGFDLSDYTNCDVIQIPQDQFSSTRIGDATRGIEGLIVTDEWLLPIRPPRNNRDGRWFYLLDELNRRGDEYVSILYYGFLEAPGRLSIVEASAYDTRTDRVPTATERTEPVPTEPVPTEPVSTEPVSTEPVSTEPVSTEPVSTEPVSTEPAPTEPRINRACTNRARINRACTNRACINRACTNRASTNRASTNRASTNRACINRACINRARINRACTNRACTNRA